MKPLAAVCVLALAVLPSCATTPDTQVTGPPRVERAPDVVRPDYTPAPTTIVPPTTTTHYHPPTTTTTVADVAVLSSSTPVPARVGECGGWESLVAAYFPADQVAKGCSVLMCESEGNPTARNPRSTASGLWQFLDSTWGGRYGVPSAYMATPAQQTAAAAELWRSSGWRPWVCA